MGMFDDVKVEYPLPDPTDTETEFQSKSLDCLLDQYTITADGRLLVNVYREEPIPESDQKPNALGIVWKTRRVLDGQAETDYHGDMEIHSRNRYIVRFTEGRVKWIRKVETCA